MDEYNSKMGDLEEMGSNKEDKAKLQENVEKKKEATSYR